MAAEKQAGQQGSIAAYQAHIAALEQEVAQWQKVAEEYRALAQVHQRYYEDDLAARWALSGDISHSEALEKIAGMRADQLLVVEQTLPKRAFATVDPGRADPRRGRGASQGASIAELEQQTADLLTQIARGTA